MKPSRYYLTKPLSTTLEPQQSGPCWSSNSSHQQRPTVSVRWATVQIGRRSRHGLTTWATARQNRAPQIETKVYVNPTITGLLLHNHSHVDMRYKRGLLKTMLDRAYRLSACWSYFSVECDRLRRIFFRLKYPLSLIISTIRDFVALKVEDQPLKPAPAESPPVRIVSPAI